MTVAEALRQIRVTQQTFCRWRKLYGGTGTEQYKEPKRLQKENERVPRAVSDLTLAKLILAGAAKGNVQALRVAGKCIDHVRQELGMSQRRACRTFGPH